MLARSHAGGQHRAAIAAYIVGIAVASEQRPDGFGAAVLLETDGADWNAEETAAALEVSVPTVVRDWRMARAWLLRELGGA